MRAVASIATHSDELLAVPSPLRIGGLRAMFVHFGTRLGRRNRMGRKLESICVGIESLAGYASYVLLLLLLPRATATCY